MKKAKGTEKEVAVAAKTKKEKSSSAAPAKKNFAESKEKEYTGKSNK